MEKSLSLQELVPRGVGGVQDSLPLPASISLSLPTSISLSPPPFFSPSPPPFLSLVFLSPSSFLSFHFPVDLCFYDTISLAPLSLLLSISKEGPVK